MTQCNSTEVNNMPPTVKALLPIAAVWALSVMNVQAATEAERIAALEQQLSQQRAMMQQQQQMMEAMDAELKRLKAGESGAAIASTTVATVPQAPVAASTAAPPQGNASDKLSMTVYGFVQADGIYDFKRVDPNWEDTLRVTTIPTQSGTYGNDGNALFSVRQSRLGIKGEYGPDITYKLEGELFGVGSDQGQTTLRVRHAWATYKDFGMGQTWSNFMDIDIFPNTIDYWGPTGMVFYRNKQARYTFPLGNDSLFAVSLEDPSTALTVGQFRDTNNCNLPNPAPDCQSVDSTAGEVFQSYNDIPDLTARYRQDGDFGHYQVAGIVRKLGYERLDTGSKDYEVGWGINTSTGLKTWGADMLKLQVAYGEGIGNYMNDGGIDIAPDSADIFSAGAETVPTWGISTYYDHYWNEKWASTVGWSMTDLDTSDGQAGTEFKQGQIATINLLHYPADHVLLGTEFSWGQREDIDGNMGSDYRIQFSLKVDFDTGNLMSTR
jgi:DcaP outer membrane protein